MLAMGTTQAVSEGTFRAYAALIQRRRAKAKGSPNILLRELGMIHENASYVDLDPEYKRDIQEISLELQYFLAKQGLVIVPKPE